MQQQAHKQDQKLLMPHDLSAADQVVGLASNVGSRGTVAEPETPVAPRKESRGTGRGPGTLLGTAAMDGTDVRPGSDVADDDPARGSSTDGRRMRGAAKGSKGTGVRTGLVNTAARSGTSVGGGGSSPENFTRRGWGLSESGCDGSPDFLPRKADFISAGDYALRGPC